MEKHLPAYFPQATSRRLVVSIHAYTSTGQKQKAALKDTVNTGNDLKAIYVNNANSAVHFQRGQPLIDFHQQPLKEQGIQNFGDCIPEEVEREQFYF